MRESARPTPWWPEATHSSYDARSHGRLGRNNETTRLESPPPPPRHDSGGGLHRHSRRQARRRHPTHRRQDVARGWKHLDPHRHTRPPSRPRWADRSDLLLGSRHDSKPLLSLRPEPNRNETDCRAQCGNHTRKREPLGGSELDDEWRDRSRRPSESLHRESIGAERPCRRLLCFHHVARRICDTRRDNREPDQQCAERHRAPVDRLHSGGTPLLPALPNRQPGDATDGGYLYGKLQRRCQAVLGYGLAVSHDPISSPLARSP